MPNTNKINQFRDEHYFLSNFYEAPVTYNGLTYQNNEAAFQAQKCRNPEEKAPCTKRPKRTPVKKFITSISSKKRLVLKTKN